MTATKTPSLAILVVEDERPLLNAIKMKLEGSGFTVLTARSSEQALAELEQHKEIGAIWLDHYLLGKESGLDFLAKIKNDSSAFQQVPVFVISNTASADKISSYMKLGAHKYLTKSNHRLDEIIGEIKKAVNEGDS